MSAGTDHGVRMRRVRSDPVALSAFIGAAVLAGGNTVGIRVGLRELDLLWSACLRFALASLVLGILMIVLRIPWPRGGQLVGAVGFGAIGLAAAFALGGYGLQLAHAGFAQSVFALVPLATLALVVAVRQERPTAPALAGALVAAIGVAVISWRGAPEPVPAATVLALLGAVVCMALAAVVVRRFPPVHPLAMNAVAAPVAAVALLAGSLAGHESPRMPAMAATWLAILYVALVGSVVVGTLQLVVLKHWSASRAAYQFVVIPTAALPISAWLDDEPIGLGLMLGAALIGAGVYLGALRGNSLPPPGAMPRSTSPTTATSRGSRGCVATPRSGSMATGNPSSHPRGARRRRGPPAK